MMRTLLLFLLALSTASAGIREGGTARVKADSMWFTSLAILKSWRADKSQTQELLNERAAWQFSAEEQVRVLQYLPHEHLVKVVMILPKNHQDHRFDGVQWWLEDSDIAGGGQ